MTIPGYPPNLPNHATPEQFKAPREIIRDHAENQEEPIGTYMLLRELGEERFPTSPGDVPAAQPDQSLASRPEHPQETSDWNPIEFDWSNEQRVHGLFGREGEPW